MAVAIEELTPEAQAIAASLHPEVKSYLEKKAGAAAAAAADKAARQKAKLSSRQGGQRSASRGEGSSSDSSGSDPLGDAARFERKLDAITPGRGVHSGTGGRLITAAFLGILVLEVLSYALGQPFSFSLSKATGGKVGDLSKTPYKPLYAGQQVSGMQGHGL